jgi:hypothetical protein
MIASTGRIKILHSNGAAFEIDEVLLVVPTSPGFLRKANSDVLRVDLEWRIFEWSTNFHFGQVSNCIMAER